MKTDKYEYCSWPACWLLSLCQESSFRHTEELARELALLRSQSLTYTDSSWNQGAGGWGGGEGGGGSFLNNLDCTQIITVLITQSNSILIPK